MSNIKSYVPYIHNLVLDNGQVMGYRMIIFGDGGTLLSCDFDSSVLYKLIPKLESLEIHLSAIPIVGYIDGDMYKTYSQDNSRYVDDYLYIERALNTLPKVSESKRVQSRLNARLLYCKALLYDIDVPIQNVNNISSNSGLRSALGRCKKAFNSSTCRSFSIEIAEYIAIGARSKLLDDVIIHELIHTVDGCFNHGIDWKSWAKIVNIQYGYNIARTTKMYYKDIFADELIKNGYAGVQCNNCGCIQLGKVDSSFIKCLDEYYCYCEKGSGENYFTRIF